MKDETYIALSRIVNLSQGVLRSEDKGASVTQALRLMRRAACSAGPRILVNDDDASLVQKAADAISMGDWDNADVQTLLTAFIGSLAERNLFDALLLYGVRLSGHFRAVTLASGFTGNATAEGFPKAVKRPTFSGIASEPRKVTGIVILTDEIARLDHGEPVFRGEVERAVNRALNAAVVSMALDAAGSPSPVIAPVGADHLANLRALLSSLPATEGVVVAAQTGIVADLALRAEASAGFSLRGGEFRRGLSIIAVDDLAVPAVAVAASRVALIDHGLRFASVREATAEISDDPSVPNASTVATSLWQHGLVGLRVERSFELNVPADSVAVLGA